MVKSFRRSECVMQSHCNVVNLNATWLLDKKAHAKNFSLGVGEMRGGAHCFGCRLDNLCSSLWGLIWGTLQGRSRCTRECVCMRLCVCVYVCCVCVRVCVRDFCPCVVLSVFMFTFVFLVSVFFVCVVCVVVFVCACVPYLCLFFVAVPWGSNHQYLPRDYHHPNWVNHCFNGGLNLGVFVCVCSICARVCVCCVCLLLVRKAHIWQLPSWHGEQGADVTCLPYAYMQVLKSIAGLNVY